MKLILAGDLHGNFEAWKAFPEDYDELWVLGDLVNYGPEPGEVVADIMVRASVVVRGNHDDAVVSKDPAPWKPRWRVTAERTRQFTASVLSGEQMAFLGGLPLQARLEREGTTFFLTHAAPSDPLYGHHAPDDDGWVAEMEAAGTDVLVVGHSHLPFLRRIGNRVLLNPGSIGQPRNGDVRASYAVWEDGQFSLRTYSYPVEATIRKLKALAYPPEVEADLVAILRTGRA